MRTMLVLGVLILGLLSVSSVFGGTSIVHGTLSSLKPHGTIYITNNTQFTSANGVTGGSGTASNPYVIEGWEIDSSSTTTFAGIDIRYTSVYFVIRNVYVHGLSDGIDLLYVTNARIENNTLANDSNGISLKDSYYDRISNNVVSGVQESIWLDDSGFDYCLNNTVNGSTGTGIWLQGYATKNITVTGNVVTGGSAWGLVVGGANETIVSHNQFLSVPLGIDVDGSRNTWIFENSFVNDGQWIATHFGGITHTFHNDFLSLTNRPGVYVDPLSTTFWDNGYPSGGNYWFDYAGVDNCSGPGQNLCPKPDGIGDTPYQIDFVNRDNYPLMRPFGPQPKHAPVWPTGSSLTASSITTGSLTLSWTSAIGATKYHVYEFSKLIGNVSATSFSVAGLVLGGTYSFKVEAGDAWGNYTIDGPGLTVRVLAQGAILGYVAWYVGPPYQGGSTLIVSNFTSFGQDPVSATRVTMTGDLGSFLVPGLPLNLTSGENRIVNMTITIPTSAYVGNHTVTITVYWNYRDAQTGVWNSASPITITGKIPVLAGPGPSTGPSSPSSSNNRPSVPRDILGLLAGLPEMAGQLILPGLAVYLLLVITAIGLVSRNGRKRAILHASYRTCLNCKTPAGAYDVFCGTCGTRLPP